MPIRRVDAFLLGATASLGLTWGAMRPRPGRATASTGVHPPQPGSGWDADSPERIPVRGWWGVAKRVFEKINSDGLLAQAAGVTFYALLALFPALASLVSVYGLFADPETIEQNLGVVSGIVPGGGMEIITQQVHSLTANSHAALSLGLIVGLATSLWSTNAGVKAMFDALNVVYEEREKRGFFTRTLISFSFTIGAIAFIIVALAGVVVLPALLAGVGLENTGLGSLGLGDAGPVLIAWLRWPVLLVIVAAMLSLLYRYGPSRRVAKWRWVSWGATFASVSWVVVSLGFSWYVQNFGTYNKTYGSLGAVVGFMTWIWLSIIVVLIGAELNAELEHTTARDSTEGAERPLGARGAVKADTVAA